MRRDADPLGIRQPPQPAPALVNFNSRTDHDLNFVGPSSISPRTPHSGRRALSSRQQQPQQQQQQRLQQHHQPQLPVSHDVSFLADDAAYRRHGGQPAPPEPIYAGTQQEWKNFKKHLESRRAVNVRAAPAKLPTPMPGGGMRTPRNESRDSPSHQASSASSSWANKGFTQNQVAALLFPAEARQVEAAISSGGVAHPLSPPPPPQPGPGQMFAKPLSTVEVLEHTGHGQAEPSGRAQALRLAMSLSQSVGTQSTPGLPPALTPRAATALSAPTDPASASIVAAHQAILALAPTDVAPHQAELDRACGELVRQVGGHCAEQAILIEYLRRHHIAAAQTARLLLQRLQLTVGMYEELRQAMDGSLLQRFQDSLGDAFAAMKLDEVAPVSGRRGSMRRASTRSGAAAAAAAGGGAHGSPGSSGRQSGPAGALSPELRPDIA